MSKLKKVAKKETIEMMHQETGFTKKDLNIMYDAFVNSFLDTLRDGNKFFVRGLFTAESYTRQATQRRSPQTGEILDIPPKPAVRFTPGKLLKESIS
jgi:DNA-binding protein HU-beta